MSSSLKLKIYLAKFIFSHKIIPKLVKSQPIELDLLLLLKELLKLCNISLAYLVNSISEKYRSLSQITVSLSSSSQMIHWKLLFIFYICKPYLILLEDTFSSHF